MIASVCPSGFVRFTLFTTSWVQDYVVQRMFISRGIQNGSVCNLLLFRLVGRLRSITLLIAYTIGMSHLRICAMHEANTALLDIVVDNSVIIPSYHNRANLDMFVRHSSTVF